MTQSRASLRVLKPKNSKTSAPGPELDKLDDTTGLRDALRKVHAGGGQELRSGASRRNIYTRKP